MSRPPVLRRIADREALTAFIGEAASHGYAAVIIAPDVAQKMGAPTSTPISVMVEWFVVQGCALAMPPLAFEFPKEEG